MRSRRWCCAAASFALSLGVPGAAAQDGRSLLAEHLPRVVHRGGPFLRRPMVTTVTFAGDDTERVSRLVAFGVEIVRSSWWREVTDGYCLGAGDCVGPGRAGRDVRLAQRLPSRIRDVDIEALLVEEAKRGALTGLEPDALVVAYLPAGVALGDAFHPRYCGGGPRAFHRMARAGDVSFPFAVIPHCGEDGETTATASHEILEATANPDPNRPGFRLAAAATAFAAAGAEPADPCGLLNRDRHRADEGTFRVQRAWSNRAAETGTDPCVPSVPERPYLALVPRQSVVRLASDGASASVSLDAVSDRAVPTWTVAVVDLTGDTEGARYLEVRLDRDRVAPGDVAVLTVRRLRRHPRGMAVVGLVSRAGSHDHVWPLAVSMR